MAILSEREVEGPCLRRKTIRPKNRTVIGRMAKVHRKPLKVGPHYLAGPVSSGFYLPYFNSPEIVFIVIRE